MSKTINIIFQKVENFIIIGKWKLYYHGLPCLIYVLLVHGHIANLINICQLCIQDLCVNFNKYECTTTNKNHAQMMKGSKFRDYCYM